MSEDLNKKRAAMYNWHESADGFLGFISPCSKSWWDGFPPMDMGERKYHPDLSNPDEHYLTNAVRGKRRKRIQLELNGGWNY